VFVSINYRLGPFGWFTHPAFKENRSRADDSGNYGTLDIIHALKWISENIRAFGGDPDNVIISGGAGGGRNVLSLIISPMSKGLFTKAICQSGSPLLHDPVESHAVVEGLLACLLVQDKRAKTEKDAAHIIRTMTGQEIREYLRSKKKNTIMEILAPGIEELLEIPDIFTDGYVIPEEGYSLLDSGIYPNKVPLIIGSNKDDINLFLSFVPELSWESDEYRATGEFGSLLFKTKGVDEIAGKLAGIPDQPPVYVYLFSWGSPDENGNSPLPGENGEKMGAFHGLEVPFFLGTNIVFNTFLLSTLFTRQNRAGRTSLSSAMMSYVSGFAETGCPNSGDPALPEWKPWSNVPGEAKYIVFNADCKTPDIFISYKEVTREGIFTRMNYELDPSVYTKAYELIQKLVE
jgi:para-nitrobenzyl esterase